MLLLLPVRTLLVVANIEICWAFFSPFAMKYFQRNRQKSFAMKANVQKITFLHDILEKSAKQATVFLHMHPNDACQDDLVQQSNYGMMVQRSKPTIAYPSIVFGKGLSFT